MTFSEAWEKLKEGKMVKLPAWAGYWALENDTIMVHCKDGKIVDLFNSNNKLYTLANIASDEWIEAYQVNTPLLGGHISLTFAQMSKYLPYTGKGCYMRRRSWDKHEYIYDDGANIRICDGRNDMYEGEVYSFIACDFLATDWEFYHDYDFQ